MAEKRKKKFFDILFDIFIAAELVAMLNTVYIQYKDNHLTIPYFNEKYIMSFEEIYKYSYLDNKYPYGKNAGENFKTSPVVIFGDSCAYGFELSEEDKFYNQLAQFIKRPVYNRASGGWSVQNTYWLLMNEDFYKEYKQEPKAVIFVYTPVMFRRMYAPELSNGLRYTVIGDNIIRNPNIINWLNISYLYSKLSDIYAVFRSKFFDNSFDIFKVYLIKGKNNADKHWKNTSFYILKFTDVADNDNPEKWKELESEGFKIIEVKELMGENYSKIDSYFMNVTDNHPSRLFWEECIPKMAEKMDL